MTGMQQMNTDQNQQQGVNSQAQAQTQNQQQIQNQAQAQNQTQAQNLLNNLPNQGLNLGMHALPSLQTGGFQG